MHRNITAVKKAENVALGLKYIGETRKARVVIVEMSEAKRVTWLNELCKLT